MKLFKRILPCLLILASVLLIVGCKKNKDTYKYPNEVPALSSEIADKSFVKIGNYNVTNKEAYYRLLQSYGLQTVKDIIDGQLLASVTLTTEQEAEYQEYLNQLIYGVKDPSTLDAEEKEKAEKTFKSSMVSEGLLVDEADKANELFYANYYKTAFKRYIKTLEAYKNEIVEADKKAVEENKDKTFNDDAYVTYFNNNYHKDYELILVTFDSEMQALNMLTQYVDADSLVGEWKKNGTPLSKSEIVNVFNTLYNESGLNGEATKTYTHKELSNISASVTKDLAIVNKVATLSTDKLLTSYTHGPVAYGNRWFMVLVLNEGTYKNADGKEIADTDENFVKDEAGNISKLTEKLQAELFDAMVLNKLSSDNTAYQNRIEKTMMELRQEANLELFAEGLETVYKTNYDAVYKALEITEYDPFNATKNTSKTLIAKWNNGEIKADDLFVKLSDRYGALLSLLFIEKYVALKDSNVIDITNNTVKDNDKYQSYVKADYTAYKEAFESGNFETYGFGKEYGWTNFLRDYVGIEVEANIVTDYESELYKDALNEVKKSLYRASADSITLTAKTVDDVTTWHMTSTEFDGSYNTNVVVVDENVKPTVSVAWKLDDVTIADADKSSTKLKDVYGHFVLTYKNAEGNEVHSLTPVTVDQKVLEKYNELFDATFTATVNGLYVYYDLDLDGVADEMAEEDCNDAKALNDLLWNKAKARVLDNKESKINANLTAVVREYKLATASDPVFGAFKAKGLQINIINGSTYTKDTAVDESLLAVAKNMWIDIVDYSITVDVEAPDGTINTENKKIAITGQELDPGYRFVNDDDVYYVTCYDFADNYAAVYANNGYTRIAVTKATTKTSQFVDDKAGNYPTVYEYEQSLLKAEDRDEGVSISSAVSSRITAYYTPAISAITSDDVMNTIMMESCEALLTEVTFGANQDKNISILAYIIDEAIEDK